MTFSFPSRSCLTLFAFIVYAIVTELPAVYVLYDSPSWSGAFLLAIFSVSVWNGGGFYIEVFGRKCVICHLRFYKPINNLIRFERELDALRKELAEATARSGRSSPTSDALGFASDDDVSTLGSPTMSPKVLPTPLAIVTSPTEMESKKTQ